MKQATLYTVEIHAVHSLGTNIYYTICICSTCTMRTETLMYLCAYIPHIDCDGLARVIKEFIIDCVIVWVPVWYSFITLHVNIITLIHRVCTAYTTATCSRLPWYICGPLSIFVSPECASLLFVRGCMHEVSHKTHS